MHRRHRFGGTSCPAPPKSAEPRDGPPKTSPNRHPERAPRQLRRIFVPTTPEIRRTSVGLGTGWRGRARDRPLLPSAAVRSDDSVDPGYVAVRSPAAYTVEVDGEAVILDEEAERLHLLNPSASLLWACFDGESSLADICADLAEALGTPLEVVLADSLDALRKLVEEGLVEDARD